MSSYVDNVKRNIAGQGRVSQLRDEDQDPAPVMPPPMKLLPIVTCGGKYDQRPASGLQTASACWACAGCGGRMEPGEVAVFAERAGADKCWHPDCFSCCECGEILEVTRPLPPTQGQPSLFQDLLYYYSHDQLYCGRHFALKMDIPRCAACDELIFSVEFTAAEERFWHLKHFCCWMCDTPLAGHKYIPVEGMPHCLGCWQSHHGKTCHTCHGVIHPQVSRQVYNVHCTSPVSHSFTRSLFQDKRVSLGERHWHTRPECFKCGVCGLSLMGAKMCMKQGTPLCSSRCAALLASKPDLSSSLASLASRSSGSSSGSLSPPPPPGTARGAHYRPGQSVSFGTIV